MKSHRKLHFYMRFVVLTALAVTTESVFVLFLPFSLFTAKSTALCSESFHFVYSLPIDLPRLWSLSNGAGQISRASFSRPPRAMVARSSSSLEISGHVAFPRNLSLLLQSDGISPVSGLTSVLIQTVAIIAVTGVATLSCSDLISVLFSAVPSMRFSVCRGKHLPCYVPPHY